MLIPFAHLYAAGDGPGWWILFGPVLWGLAIFAVIRLLGRRRPWAPRTPRERPLELLDRRFAEGSIELEEYLERRSVLAGNDRAR